MPLLISSLLPLGRGPPLGCRAEIRTRACHTASRRATDWATPHPDVIYKLFLPKGVFGKWHPGWGREYRKAFLRCMLASREYRVLDQKIMRQPKSLIFFFFIDPCIQQYMYNICQSTIAYTSKSTLVFLLAIFHVIDMNATHKQIKKLLYGWFLFCWAA